MSYCHDDNITIKIDDLFRPKRRNEWDDEKRKDPKSRESFDESTLGKLQTDSICRAQYIRYSNFYIAVVYS